MFGIFLCDKIKGKNKRKTKEKTKKKKKDNTKEKQKKNKALARAQLAAEDVDLFEINEAFAAVVLACSKLLGIPLEKARSKPRKKTSVPQSRSLKQAHAAHW